MGAWGFGVTQDDTVADVIGEFEDLVKSGTSVSKAFAMIAKEIDSSDSDPDDVPLGRIGLAYVQWRYSGTVAPKLIARIRKDHTTGVGLERWREAGPAELKRRRLKVQQFLERVSEPNPTPKPPPRQVVRAPKFQPGDCLSVLLENEKFGAALVLASDHSRPEYGHNLIATLDFMSDVPPTLSVFKARKWLRLTHHSWNNVLDVSWYGTERFRAQKDRFTVMGSIAILPTDALACKSYSGWHHLGEQVILERHWRRTHKQGSGKQRRK